MNTPKTTNPPQVRVRRVQEQKKTSISNNSTVLLDSCQVIPTTFTDLVGSDEELEILANFIPAQEADQ